ncbi:MAG: methionine sulfoxide reductase heme-binding subunit [Patescibacteria group bacterium]|nr:methionine sulfoxide reductase heme-binding subunit [Patescibacteria group bacterium]
MSDVPWAWYLSRASALVGFSLLYISIFLGLAVRTPFLNKIIKPVYSLRAHCWISLQALIFALIHGLALLFDKFIDFSLADIFIPFVSEFETGLIALGIISFYLMIILVVSSYLKQYVSQRVWRALHSLNVGLYMASIIHAFYLGTDMKEEMIRNVFIYANLLLIALFAVNILIRLRLVVGKKIENNENLR